PAPANAPAKAPTESCLQGEAEHERPEPVEDVAAEQPARQVARIAAGEPHSAVARQLERDLRAGVAGADDEHRPVGEIEWRAVVARVELMDALVESCRDGGNVRPLEWSRRDDDVVGLERSVVGVQDPA